MYAVCRDNRQEVPNEVHGKITSNVQPSPRGEHPLGVLGMLGGVRRVGKVPEAGGVVVHHVLHRAALYPHHIRQLAHHLHQLAELLVRADTDAVLQRRGEPHPLRLRVDVNDVLRVLRHGVRDRQEHPRRVAREDDNLRREQAAAALPRARERLQHRFARLLGEDRPPPRRQLPTHREAVRAVAMDHAVRALGVVRRADEKVAWDGQAVGAHLPLERRLLRLRSQQRRPRLLSRLAVRHGDDVAVGEDSGGRGGPRVDLGRRGVARGAEGFRRVGESRAARQVEDLSVGCEDEDARAQQLLPHQLHELMRAVEVPPLAHAELQPRQRGARAALLVRPVRRRAELRDVMHLDGADLDLERLRADEDRRVQRAVAIRLGRGDVVLERARQRRPQPVDLAEHVVAQRLRLGGLAAVRRLALRLERVHHHAQRHQVVHLLRRAAVAEDLLPRRVARLGAPRDGDVVDPPLQPPVGLEALGQLSRRGGEEALVALELRVDEGVDLLVLGGAQVLEAQVGQLRAELPHAEAVGERREDLEGLARDGDPLGRRHVLERAHVVQPVGQLDDDDPPVLRHRDEHRAQVLRLLVHLVARRRGRVAQRALVLHVGHARLHLAAHHLGQLAHLRLPLDDPPHRRAEERIDLLEGDVGVLDDVVQQPRDDRRLVHLEAREDHRHLEGVRDVRLATPPPLAEVSEIRHFERHALAAAPVGRGVEVARLLAECGGVAVQRGAVGVAQGAGGVEEARRLLEDRGAAEEEGRAGGGARGGARGDEARAGRREGRWAGRRAGEGGGEGGER
mmetsp:Transcript_39678/g.96315  ORF Transcript_39678/g.96315 Transcript_39678/m.96315 type:complete len:793 (+) Transcript_39678:198-2576(+)